MTNQSAEHLRQLADEVKSFSGLFDFNLSPLPFSGSHRRYFRIILPDNFSFIACYNEDIRENTAFIQFSKTFKKHNLPVPDILYVSRDEKIYFQSDLGNITLFKWIQENKSDERSIKSLLEQALADLLRFQTCPDVPYNYAYPVSEFNELSIRWDLNYFKYLFLRLANITFDEYQLEKEFNKWAEKINSLPRNYFMYRDFQSRNIMLYNNQFFYIDYQGGRRGNLLYDVASLLYDAKLNLPANLRFELREFHAKQLERSRLMTTKDFFDYFPYLALTRIMQAFGSYGLRGLYERKTHFIESIPFAANNLWQFIDIPFIQKEFPVLHDIFRKIIEKYTTHATIKATKLQVTIFSFSLKKGYPLPHPEHGGGFIFDCRSLPNPGQIPELEKFNGTEEPIISFMEAHTEVKEFIEHAFEILKHAITNYLSRGFTYLSAGFGCTGGKHRSVFCASYVAQKLKETFQDKAEIKLFHNEFPS